MRLYYQKLFKFFFNSVIIAYFQCISVYNCWNFKGVREILNNLKHGKISFYVIFHVYILSMFIFFLTNAIKNLYSWLDQLFSNFYQNLKTKQITWYFKYPQGFQSDILLSANLLGSLTSCSCFKENISWQNRNRRTLFNKHRFMVIIR